MAEVLVKEGDVVSANQALLRLNGAWAQANVAQATGVSSQPGPGTFDRIAGGPAGTGNCVGGRGAGRRPSAELARIRRRHAEKTWPWPKPN